ncbi:hypothetical protein BRLA_c003380 [Brevibacillus laterosporus LMG 15441]|uniref:Uncharacterized protein n=1 Tax=Brevibacillus laterosporus LMG 15441 TaxID=1042163 RepID=A0A075R0L4_BRELA|nr:hypothetical protein BRLA_c003380 [Brevibacillus laterosporus LMG 15441]
MYIYELHLHENILGYKLSYLLSSKTTCFPLNKTSTIAITISIDFFIILMSVISSVVGSFLISCLDCSKKKKDSPSNEITKSLQVCKHAGARKHRKTCINDLHILFTKKTGL